MNWIPYPRAGTHVEDGDWLCTVEVGTSLQVEILGLEGADWFRNTTERLSPRERVVAIAYVPEPATQVIRLEAKRTAKLHAVIAAANWSAA